MKIYILLFIIFFISSCFYQEKQDEINSSLDIQKEEKIINSQEELFLKNEKTTKIEEEFSKDLNDLFNFISQETDVE